MTGDNRKGTYGTSAGKKDGSSGGNRSSQKTINENWSVRYGRETYPIYVTFKDMQSVRLRVSAGGAVRLSAPVLTDREWLMQFLVEHVDWIAQNVEKMQDLPVRQPEKRPPLTQEERQEALEYLMPMVDKWYPAVECRGVAYPHVTVRAMTTRFGTCSVNRGRITLNSVLLKVPRACAEYVVLHELTHFLYPNHSRQFYDYIAGYMPDWQERERLLKVSV